MIASGMVLPRAGMAQLELSGLAHGSSENVGAAHDLDNYPGIAMMEGVVARRRRACLR